MKDRNFDRAVFFRVKLRSTRPPAQEARKLVDRHLEIRGVEIADTFRLGQGIHLFIEEFDKPPNSFDAAKRAMGRILVPVSARLFGALGHGFVSLFARALEIKVQRPKELRAHTKSASL